MSHAGLTPIAYWILVLDRWGQLITDHRIEVGQKDPPDSFLTDWCQAQYGVAPVLIDRTPTLGRGYNVALHLP